ncbi:MAG: DEAD/DEAH box helicase [Planctomycetota bacterium]
MNDSEHDSDHASGPRPFGFLPEDVPATPRRRSGAGDPTQDPRTRGKVGAREANAAAERARGKRGGEGASGNEDVELASERIDRGTPFGFGALPEDEGERHVRRPWDEEEGVPARETRKESAGGGRRKKREGGAGGDAAAAEPAGADAGGRGAKHPAAPRNERKPRGGAPRKGRQEPGVSPTGTRPWPVDPEAPAPRVDEVEAEVEPASLGTPQTSPLAASLPSSAAPDHPAVLIDDDALPVPPSAEEHSTAVARAAAHVTEYAPDGRIVKWKGYTLSRFQLQAIDAIRRGCNVLVSAPTGAGKTLVAEYAIEDAVRQGKRCIYTAPIKALSNQKYRDFRDDPDIDVGLMTGDVTMHPEGRVLIMTTEILRNAIFENPRLLHDVAYVIFDEVHYLDDKERGTVWEESLIFLPPGIRVIALSATIQNVEELGNWVQHVRTEDNVVIKDSRRPVPLSHWVHTTLSGTFDAGSVDRARKREAREADRLGPRRSRSTRAGGRRRGARGGGRNRREEEGFEPFRLFDELIEREMLPALIFSFSRKDCERLARRVARRGLLDREETARMEVLQEELVQLFQLGRGHLRGELFQMTRAGVGYHHAGMLPVYKEVVERMFTAGLLKMLFTTETFALGINMPAKAVVFHGLKKFDGVTFDWLRTRDYMQMAGRAGRQGIDDKGFVFQLLSTSELQEAPVKAWISGSPEPVMSRFHMNYSTLLHLVKKLGRQQVHVAWEKSFAAWQGREKNAKAREKQLKIQRRIIDRHFQMLEQLGYLDGDLLTPRGELAKMLPGYELQLTELLFRGVLENVPARGLALIAVAMIYEERRAANRPYIPHKLFGPLRAEVDAVIGDLCQAEAAFGIGPSMKRADWGLTQATLDWFGGASMDDLEDDLGVNAGDVCRVLRMAIQLLRNVRRSIDKKWDLAEKLEEAALALNRDEVDARRQLELG